MRRVPSDRTRLALALLLAALLPGCATDASPPPAPAHRVLHVGVAPGVSLEVLDWGGTGPPVVFLAGIGDTGHSFDDFAPEFTDHWHVYAITRRGYGASSHPDTGYDVPTFAADVEAVLDSLALDTVTFVGHSFAGDEITRIAAEQPDRVTRLVYLDAGYDRVGELDVLREAAFPDDPAMTMADSASAEAVGDYLERLNGFRLNDDELHQWFVFDSTGRMVAKRSADTIWTRTILPAVDHPPFAEVRASALVIYAVPEDPADVLPWYPAADTAWQRRAEHAFTVWSGFRRRDRDSIPGLLSDARVVELPGASHYVFVSDRARVLGEMRQFLEGS